MSWVLVILFSLTASSIFSLPEAAANPGLCKLLDKPSTCNADTPNPGLCKLLDKPSTCNADTPNPGKYPQSSYDSSDSTTNLSPSYGSNKHRDLR
jgi:hypothetical protein